jgi:hypothetical protein
LNLKLGTHVLAPYKPRVLCFVAAALFNQLATAATYYVSTTGNDSNAGSQSAPFRHLSKAAASAKSPGDIVLVMDGTYDNEGVVAPNFVVTLQYSGTAASPITFMAQNRGQAILDSMNTSTTTTCNGAASYLNLYNASFVVIQGFVMQHSCDSGIQSNDNAHDITIKWNDIRNVANRTVTDQYGRNGIYLNSNEYNFTFDGNSFHDIGRTDGQTLLHFDHGIYSSSRNTTVINNLFYNLNRGYAIQLSNAASTWLIANNSFAFGNANGEAGAIMFWDVNSSITIRNNIFYRPNGSALTRFAATISGSAFDNNLIFGVSSVMSGSTSGIAVGVNQIGPDPLFVNSSPSSPDFHLQSGSPAIAAGVAVPGVSSDIVGTTRPTPPDLGAYQSISTGAVPVLSSVFTSAITSNSAFVNWSTDRPSTSYVQYGPGGYSSTTPIDATMVTQHSVSVSNLAAGTLYHYRAASQDSNGNLGLSSDFTFTTSAAAGSTAFSLAASPSTATVTPGRSVTTALNATLVSGGPVTVSFSASGLPSGGVTYSSTSCTVSCSTTVTISASGNATPGVYNVVFTATGAGISASTPMTLTVAKKKP